MIPKSPSSHHHSSEYFPASADTYKAMATSCPDLPCIESILTTTPLVMIAYVEHINEQPNCAHVAKRRGGITIAFEH